MKKVCTIEHDGSIISLEKRDIKKKPKVKQKVVDTYEPKIVFYLVSSDGSYKKINY
jgi:hypothetical protein